MCHVSPKLEKCPLPACVRGRGIALRWNPWSFYRSPPESATVASRPRAEGAQVSASTPRSRGEGAHPWSLGSLPLRAPCTARTLETPHRHSLPWEGPEPTESRGGQAQELWILDTGRGRGSEEAKAMGRTRVLQNHEASVSQSVNPEMTPPATRREFVQDPFPENTWRRAQWIKS